MLSRVADSLYWMSRYLERSEHTARVIDINLHDSIDQTTGSLQRRWNHVARSLGEEEFTITNEGEPQVFSRAMAFNTKDPRSILSCIFSARRNAREVREQISVEMWEQINRMYLSGAGRGAEEQWNREAHGFLSGITEGIRLFRGLSDATMSHNEGWHFIQLGQYIERVVNTLNLLEAHFEDIGGDEVRSMPVDHYLEWVSLLKSCAVFGAYCRVYTANVQPAMVAEFLLLDPESPHSIRFGANSIGRALDAIAASTEMSRRTELFRISGKLISSLNFDRIDEIFRSDLKVYVAEIRAQCNAIHAEIYNACITYPVESAVVT